MRYGEVKAPLCSHRVDQAPAIRIDTALAGRHTHTHTVFCGDGCQIGSCNRQKVMSLAGFNGPSTSLDQLALGQINAVAVL